MNKIAIMMRIKLVGEDLNNEGTIGNIIQPRQIKLNNGEIRQAISGEMLKHYHTKNLRLLADESELCDACKIFSPIKDTKVINIDKNLSDSGNKSKNCIIDDVEGFMIASKGVNAKKTSCIKFSWAIATEENEYETMLHTRVDLVNGGKSKKDKEEDSNKNGQMIFYRPIRSNEYALTVQVDLDRIGFDDENLVDVVDIETKINRQKKTMIALKNMFIDMEGAMCTTRLPHICGIEGILVQKTNANEVLSKYSALNDDYKEVNKNICSNTFDFNNIEEFISVIDNINFTN